MRRHRRLSGAACTSSSRQDASASPSTAGCARHRSSTSGGSSSSGGEQGLLSVAFHPVVRPCQPALLRQLHRPQRAHARRRVPREPRRDARAHPGGEAVALRPAAVPQPQRRPDCVRPGRAPLRGDGRRRRRRRPAEPRAEHGHAARQARADRRVADTAVAADRRARRPQPMAVLVRPSERRPLDGGRRPERVGGDRLPAAVAARRADQLRLGRLRGARAVREQGARRAARWCSRSRSTRTASAARSRVGSSTAVPPCRPRAGGTSTATTAAGSSGACARSTAAPPTSGANRSGSRGCRASARTRAVSCTRRRSTARVYRLAP